VVVTGGSLAGGVQDVRGRERKIATTKIGSNFISLFFNLYLFSFIKPNARKPHYSPICSLLLYKE
jgi:hypothetical protein